MNNKNLFGGLITMLIGAIAFIFFILFVMPIINRDNPSLLMTKFSQKLITTILSPNDNQIAFSLWSGEGISIPEPERVFKFKVAIQTNKFTKTSNGTLLNSTKEFYDVVKCSKGSFGNKFESIFQNSRWGDLYCLDYQSMGGRIFLLNPAGNGYDFSMMNIVILRCSNNTDNNIICKSPEDIQKILSSYMVHLDLLDYSVEHLNFTNPIKPGRVSHNTLSFSSMYRRISLEFKSIVYESDNGIFLTDIQRTVVTSIDNIDETLAPRDTFLYSPGELGVIAIRNNNKGLNDLYSRRYVKMQAIIANVGGFMQIVRIIGNLLVTFYSHFDLYYKIISNSYYKYDIEEKTVNNDNSNSVKMNDQRLLTEVPQRKGHKNATHNLYQHIPKFNRVKYSKYKLFFSLKSVLCCCTQNKNKDSEKLNILNNVLLNKCKDELDIKQYLKLVHEFNYFKTVYFEKVEIRNFEIISNIYPTEGVKIFQNSKIPKPNKTKAQEKTVIQHDPV
jgi:hypothetical protein